MAWRWFRDWRERRSALRDLKLRQREDEDGLASRDPNPIQLTQLALERGELVEAHSRWDQARILLPNVTIESRDSLGILLGLKRYDEAEALMREGWKRFPLDRFYLTGLAIIAEQRGDFQEALKRWEATRDGADKPLAYAHGGICLRALGRLDEADTLFDEAIRLDPDYVFAWLERARVSDKRLDWPESLVRWKFLADHFNFGPGFAGHAKALSELGRIDEAEAYLDVAATLHPSDLEIAVTRSHLARLRGDRVAECERWGETRRIAPYVPIGYSEGAQCLFNAERYEEADAVMRTAIERFPNEAWPLFDFANIAHRRQKWNEAIVRWDVLRLRFPDHEAGYSHGIGALDAAGRHEEATALRATVR